MEEYKELIGKKIKYLREKNNITQQFLADQIDGMTVQMVCAYEKGKQYPSLKNLINFSKYFKVPLDFFCSNDYDIVNINDKRIKNYSDLTDFIVSILFMKQVYLSNYVDKYNRGITAINVYDFNFKDLIEDCVSVYNTRTIIKDDFFESLVDKVKEKYKDKIINFED